MVIDAHVHCYDPTRPEGIPHPSPDKPLLYRPMLPGELRAVAGPAGVDGAVFIECSPWLEDNRWALDLADREPFLRAVVGHLDPSAPEFPQRLARFARHPLFRGIRVRPLDPDAPAVRRNLGVLADAGLTLDVLALDRAQLPALTRLAAALPHLQIMLDHLGPVRIGRGAADADWLEAVRPLADCPNVHCKVSACLEAHTERPAPVDPAAYAPAIAAAERLFGLDRLAFGSNWPPCLQAGAYADAVRVVLDYFRRHPSPRAAAVLGRNAAAFYGGPRLA